MDSCSARKLEPGLEQTYSKPSFLITSTMKSEPGRSAVSTSTVDGGSTSLAATAAMGRVGLSYGSGACAVACSVVAVSAAAPPAALFRKLRRSTATGDFAGDFAIT